jgi:hypothetical protein
MKKVLFCWVVFLSWVCHSQNYMTSLPFMMKKDGKSFNYVDKSKDEAYVFISNAKKVRIVHFDNKFNLLDTLMTPIPGKKSDNMIGFTKNDSSINLIWTSNDGEKFLFQNLDFKTKKVTITSKDLNFNRQNVVQTFSTNDAFYCLAVVDQSSALRLYRFSNQNELEVKNFDFSSTVFNDSNNQQANLYDLFNESFDSFESSFELQNIDVTLPNSLAICAKRRKAYLNENELVLTFDNNPLSTQLVKINLTDFSSEAIKINKPGEKIVNNQSNSYYFEGNLYQFKTSKFLMMMTIKNLKGEVIKEFNTDSNAEITYKNSDFLCEWVNKHQEKNIENTYQFVTKLTDYKVGISCYNYKGKNLVSFGGVSERIKKIDPNEDESNGKGFPIAPYGSGLIGGLIYATAFVLLGGYDGTSFFYNNYKSSRNIVSVNSLFSKDFQQESDKVNNFSGTKMCSYFNGFAEIKYPTFFSTNGKPYVGYYNEDAKQYVIMKFEN